jgi:hypothetical protein
MLQGGVRQLKRRTAGGARLRSSTLVLREDPDLAEQLTADQFEPALPSSAAAVLTVDGAGGWRPPLPSNPAGWLGYLVLDGMLARKVTLERTTCTELLGPGDILEPWQRDTEIDATYPPLVEFEVLAATRLAMLDRGFAFRMARWPEIASAVNARLVERVRSLTYLLAACGRVGVAERLELVLRHFADRWGRVTSEGVVVELPGVTHELLATQVGAARPSVTTALGGLERLGRIRRISSGTWLLGHPMGSAIAVPAAA